MKLIIDDANIDEIKRIYNYYPIDGVTTNPSILAKAGKAPYDILKEIRAFIGKDAELHVQVISLKADEMIKDAERILEELGENTYVKIPSIPEGFKAMKILSKKGINITATAIYTPLQAYLAAKSGAKYVAPYINRIDDMGYDGISAAKNIHDILKKHNYETEVLAASFKNSLQVSELCQYGIGACTVAPTIIDHFANNQAIKAAVDKFISDFEGLTFSGANMNNI